jgi:ubiquinol-cytochrome c reductase iron-sulfur subunit
VGVTRDEDDLDGLTRDDLLRAGLESDGVRLVRYADRWPIPGTRAERRAVRGVITWLGLSALSGLACVVIFLAWPFRYPDPGYLYYTPLLGGAGGGCVLLLAVAIIRYSKNFLPEEQAVQDRHDDPSGDFDRTTTSALVTDTVRRAGLPRRRMVLGMAGGVVGIPVVGAVLAAIGGLIKDPWRQPPDDTVWHTGWYSDDGQKVFLRRDTGDPHEVSLVRPADLDAGALMTVYPFREKDREDPDRLSAIFNRGDTPAILIRLRPGQRVTAKPGQEHDHFGQYVAYSKLCTHLGCPVSLFEQQTDRLVCPCHQSQFDVLHAASPVFGPAARPLPQLPISVDEETGCFVATGDFRQPVGPEFWELGWQ